MSVIRNVDQKVAELIAILPIWFSENEYLEKFKERYPNDYKHCWNKFKEEEAITKAGKTHPKQYPDKHVINA